jgi:hypothetical protein
MASASSVRKSDSSPSAPPATSFSTKPDAWPNSRFGERDGEPRVLRSLRTTSRSALSSSYSHANELAFVGVRLRPTQSFHDVNGGVRSDAREDSPTATHACRASAVVAGFPLSFPVPRARRTCLRAHAASPLGGHGIRRSHDRRSIRRREHLDQHHGAPMRNR